MERSTGSGLITALNNQITRLLEVLAEDFESHPVASIHFSQPGFGLVLAARALGELAMTSTGSPMPGPGGITPGKA
jgi:hypothetical protein